MKKTVLILMLTCGFILSNAQDESPTLKGKTQINIGLGLFGWGGPNFYPLHVGMDFFIINNLSVGFDVNWRYYRNDIYSHQIFSAQAVIDYHLNHVMNLSSKWDVYAGLKIGPGYMTDADNDINAALNSGVRLVTDVRAGVRYYVSPKIAVNLEGGIMTVSSTNDVVNGVFTFGIALKL